MNKDITNQTSKMHDDFYVAYTNLQWHLSDCHMGPNIKGKWGSQQEVKTQP